MTRRSKGAAGVSSSAANTAAHPSLSAISRRVLCAGPPRERSAFSHGPVRPGKTWILETSNIFPGTKKALRLCKALISLVFLAPRPGLEPGTYGLTGWPSISPLTRMNAGFPGFELPILLVRFTSGMAGRADLTQWILEAPDQRSWDCATGANRAMLKRSASRGKPYSRQRRAVLDGDTDVELQLREIGAGPYRPSGRYSVRPRSSKGLNPKCS